MFSFFTAKQANEALPDVIKKFEYALAKKSDITKIEKELQMILSTTNSFEKYMELKKQLNSAITKFYESIEILENTGAGNLLVCTIIIPPASIVLNSVFLGQVISISELIGLLIILFGLVILDGRYKNLVK